MNEKKIICLVLSIIGLVLVICIGVFFMSYNQDRPFVPSMANIDKIVENNSDETQMYYNFNEKKIEFEKILNKVFNTISDKLFDGTVTDPSSLKVAVDKYNSILASDNWSELDLVYPNEWLGKWYLNDNGILKFKFANKSIEPSWIQEDSVKEHIVINE